MRKIFEFKAFDVVNNPDNQEFLKKVKEQNPNLYSRFVSLIGNKGLEVAKDKYKQYDPEWIKNRFKVQKREKKKENKEQKKQEILDKWKPEIDTINSLLKTSALKKEILNFIENDENISKYFKKNFIKKKYKNLFIDDLKKPFRLNNMLGAKLNRMINIDKLEFFEISFEDETISGIWYGDEINKSKKILEINQVYDLSNSEIYYNIYPSFSSISSSFEEHVSYEGNREYIQERNSEINKLRDYHLNKKELFDVIKQISYALSDEHYEEWQIRKDANRYNL